MIALVLVKVCYTFQGEVVALRDQLKWFEDRPLAGLRVLVTRTREQASSLSGSLERLGAIPVDLPVIAVEELSDTSALDDALRNIAEYDWLTFTSVNGVKAVLSRLSALGMDIRDLKGPRISAIGPGTAGPLTEAGITAVIQPGGSKRYDVVIAAANERGVAMLLTGHRHFRH